MMDGPQRNINAADLNHFKCKCLSHGVMQMRTEWRRLKLFPLLNANMFFLTRWGRSRGVGLSRGKVAKKERAKKRKSTNTQWKGGNQAKICDAVVTQFPQRHTTI